MEYFGIITFLAGYIISELIRRMNRAENFNSQIFNRRLDVFSELYSTWNSAYKNVSDLIQSVINGTVPDDVDLAEAHFQCVQPLLMLLDEKALFFSEELCVQCGAALLGPERYTVKDCQDYLDTIRTQNKVVTGMIRDESGLSMLNKNIKGIIGYKHKSELITYYSELKRKKK